MSSFTKPLKGEILDNGCIVLTESFEWYDSETKAITKVPKGFVSDFASVPQILQFLIPKIGKYSKPAVLHDFLCEEFKLGNNTRKFADDTFMEAMKVKGVNWFQRGIIYAGVRLFAFIMRYK